MGKLREAVIATMVSCLHESNKAVLVTEAEMGELEATVVEATGRTKDGLLASPFKYACHAGYGPTVEDAVFHLACDIADTIMPDLDDEEEAQ